MLPLNNTTHQDQDQVGTIAADFGELIQEKIPISKGFVITQPELQNFVNQLHINTKNSKSDQKYFTKKIFKTPFTNSFQEELFHNYLKLKSHLLSHPLVHITPSPLTKSATHYLQSQTYIQGETNVILAIKNILNAFINNHSVKKHNSKLEINFSIIIQSAILGDISGHIYTIDPVTLEKNSLKIEAVFGLPETIHQQSEIPDHYTYNKYSQSIVKKQISHQKKQTLYTDQQLVYKQLPYKQIYQSKLTDPQIIQLGKLATKIEQYYLAPQKITWTKQQDQYYIQHISPLEIHQQSRPTPKKQLISIQESKVILQGTPASPGIAKGKPHIITDQQQIKKFKKGQLAILDSPSAKYLPVIKKAAAIVTNSGSLTSELAILSREHGIPCIIGTETATQKLKTLRLVTVDATHGKIYSGAPQITHQQIEAPPTETSSSSLEHTSTPAPQTATKIDAYLNNLNPQTEIASLPLDGIGILPMEILIQQQGYHPKHLLQKSKITQIASQFADDIMPICQSFNPRPVLLRLSTLTTHQLKSLEWGHHYETTEINPLLGHYGTLRHITDSSLFNLEIKAIKQLRHKNQINNLQIIIPLVRTPDELLECKKILSAAGLNRTPSFKFWLNIAIPSNILMLNEYQKIGIDGIVIDLDHLSQLILGIEESHPSYTKAFTYNHPAIHWFLQKTIKQAHQLDMPISIFSQYLTKNSDLIEKLIQYGITRISIPPENTYPIRQLVSYCETRHVS